MQVYLGVQHYFQQAMTRICRAVKWPMFRALADFQCSITGRYMIRFDPFFDALLVPNLLVTGSEPGFVGVLGKCAEWQHACGQRGHLLVLICRCVDPVVSSDWQCVCAFVHSCICAFVHLCECMGMSWWKLGLGWQYLQQVQEA